MDDSLYEIELGEYNGTQERFIKSQELEKRDRKIYEIGLKLFTEYFEHLWD
jgi:hypothetical protein